MNKQGTPKFLTFPSNAEKPMLEFKILDDNDISLIETWLNKEHVKKWYEIPHMDITIDDWVHEIKEHNGEYKWITYLVVLLENRPIGLCQYYKCADYDEEDFGTMPLAGSYSIDYLIGEETCVGKGLGREMITLLVNKIFAFPDAKRVTADIDNNNLASKNALLSCGFELLDAGGSRYIIYKDNQV